MNRCEMIVTVGDFFKRCAGKVVFHVPQHNPDFFGPLTVIASQFRVPIHPTPLCPPRHV